jgi:hypothetical protein
MKIIFPKTLFALSQCRITEDDGSGDLHIDAHQRTG